MIWAVLTWTDLFCYYVRAVSVTADWQLNKCIVSPPVHPNTSRPEYQSSLGSRLHGKRCSGDYPRWRHRERPSGSHQQLRKSEIQSSLLICKQYFSYRKMIVSALTRVFNLVLVLSLFYTGQKTTNFKKSVLFGYSWHSMPGQMTQCSGHRYLSAPAPVANEGLLLSSVVRQIP